MQPTDRLRQVMDATQGFIGVQRLWKDENGHQEWQWLETVTMRQIGLSPELNAAARALAE